MRSSLPLMLLACLYSGCGGGSSAPAPGPIVGDGTFSAVSETPYSVGQTPTAMAAGDFNQDGVLDLAVGAHLGDRIDILLGSGDGTYTAATPVPLPANSGIFDLCIARLDAGTTLDLVASMSFNNTAIVFHGAGDGTFTLGATLTMAGGDDAMGVEVGDFDGNLTMDVAVVVRDPGLVGIFLNDGAGTFTSPIATSFSVGFEARNLVAGLFDGDTVLDLAVSVRNSEQIELYLGNGDGTFAASPFSSTTVSGQPWTLAAVDLDGGGSLDIVVAGENTGQVTTLLGDGAGALSTAPSSPVTVGASPIGIASGDFNGDEAPDIVAANIVDGTISILLGDGSGGLVPGAQPTLLVGPLPFALVVADLDGDGIQDIAVANQGDSTVTVLLGN